MKPSQIGFFTAFVFIFLTFSISAEETTQVCYSRAQVKQEAHLSSKIKKKAIYQDQEYKQAYKNALYIQKNRKEPIDLEICDKRERGKKSNLLDTIQLDKIPKA